jgi:hypothetical protein
MPESIEVRILLVRSWLHSLEPLRKALRSVDLEPRITRVDLEPALAAALSRGTFDVVIVDPLTPTISRETVEACLREHGVAPALPFAGDLDELISQVVQVIRARRN